MNAAQESLRNRRSADPIFDTGARSASAPRAYEPIDNRASLLTVAKYRSGNLLVDKRAAST